LLADHEPVGAASQQRLAMNIIHIDIGVEFAASLGPRFRRLGDHSGEEFREDLLEPAYLQADTVVVHLDAIKTFSASFFEEAFGGLARQYGAKPTLSKIRFHAIDRAYLVPMIQEWMRDADAQRLQP
jgi:hypothetical protein